MHVKILHSSVITTTPVILILTYVKRPYVVW